MQTIGENIKCIRQQTGLMQKDFGDIVGACNSTIQYWENNKSPVNSDKVIVICDEFGITPNELFGYEDIDLVKIGKLWREKNDI